MRNITSNTCYLLNNNFMLFTIIIIFDLRLFQKLETNLTIVYFYCYILILFHVVDEKNIFGVNQKTKFVFSNFILIMLIFFCVCI